MQNTRRWTNGKIHHAVQDRNPQQWWKQSPTRYVPFSIYHWLISPLHEPGCQSSGYCVLQNLSYEGFRPRSDISESRRRSDDSMSARFKAWPTRLKVVTQKASNQNISCASEKRVRHIVMIGRMLVPAAPDVNIAIIAPFSAPNSATKGTWSIFTVMKMSSPSVARHRAKIGPTMKIFPWLKTQILCKIVQRGVDGDIFHKLACSRRTLDKQT